MSRTIRIATRSSPMAVHQAEQVAAAIANLHPQLTTSLVKVTTSGDRWMGDLAKLGGKGAFIKEIDHALLNNDADIAVHCLKDIPGDIPLPEGLVSAGYLPREDLRDAVISRRGATLAELPTDSVVGTSSVRRTAQLRLHYPHLRIERLRGNINTRLKKLDDGHFDALIAAVSGLNRVDQNHRITEILPIEIMCPPIGAGTIALQCRTDDKEALTLGAALNDVGTQQQSDAERAMLHILQGHCNSPIAGCATVDSTGRFFLHGKVFTHDGSRWLDSCHDGTVDDPQSLGILVGTDLLQQGARDIMDA